MSDLRKDPPAVAGTDTLYRQLVVAAAQACAGWASPTFDDQLDLLLWPRDCDDFSQGHAFRVDARVVERGVWRVTLCPAGTLPAGVDQATRDAVLRAEITLDGTKVPLRAVDQVVQCGLFGEVLNR